ncbi:hypothetical protein BIV57_17945 [Mangrovactinospora gilvigrisea]|uniref:Uncharacterized protein n=1 Tax=Mangrovactinospora gilvigrisea TaxID=1428644 RepID=A0A1J7C3K2_9ACTN|nr:hypothetical protein [Mangrovactinospora gilvigrisea]OIV36120.1 hypothetical protein BIV57_17945 [Mangrovactinospora gilvigrisea]
MIANLGSVARTTVEENPITVRPYMITENDLSAIGHARCHFGGAGCCSSEVPAWLVNGWASCDGHLANVVRDAAHFQKWHGVWKLEDARAV